MASKTKDAMTYLPRWIKREVVESSGRDPLGLSRLSDALTTYLLPGIITTTQRARYYSFYPWLISDAEEARQSGDSLPFQEAFMQRDTAFGVASFLAQDEAELNIVGIDNIRAERTEFESSEIVDTSFRLLPSDDFGGLGSYYAPCLRDLGLLTLAPSEDRWGLTDTGRAIAAAFSRSVTATPYAKHRYNKRPEIPLQRLNESAKLFSLSGLRKAEARKERDLLIEIMFGFHSPNERAEIRRETLGLILDVINKSEAVPKGDFELLYAPHYYGVVARGDKGYRLYKAPDAWRRTRGFWRQFCAHQYFAIALEHFLASMLDTLAPYSDGLTANDLVEALTARDLVEALSDWTGERCRSPKELLNVLEIHGLPSAELCLKNRKRWVPDSYLAERSICDGLHAQELSEIAAALLILAVLYGKWRSSDDPECQQISNGWSAELWMGSLLPTFDAWLDPKATWNTVIATLVEFIFHRHEQVMFQKQRLEACWLSNSDGRFYKEQDVQAHFRSSRHVNGLQIFYDLRLVDYRSKEDDWKISKTGKQLLSRLKRGL